MRNFKRTNMKFIAIIPARYASSRFPGKPLAMLGGHTVLERVYLQARKALADVVIATDSDEIMNAARGFGAPAVMTSPTLPSGTDRVRAAFDAIGSDADVVINIQGDEPFIHPSQIIALMQCFDDPDTQIATLTRPFGPDASEEAIANPNTPKVVTDCRGFALYFSRSVIPFPRGTELKDAARTFPYQAHVGIYAYRSSTLRQITVLEPSPLELTEKLEQLRWLQHGYRIKTAVTTISTIGIDTPADLARAEQYLSEHSDPLASSPIEP